MKKIQHTTLGLALSALLAFGAVGAAAKTGSGARQREISGTVVRVDMLTRIVEMREDKGGRTTYMRIADGQSVTTNLAASPPLTLERLLPGMHIRAVVQ